MPVADFEARLGKYADVIVEIGLNIQPGQKLMIVAHLEAVPLVRAVAARAYQRGARLVDVLWDDEYLALARLENAPRDSFEEYPEWKSRAMADHASSQGAVLSIRALNPDLLSGQDTDLIMTMQRTEAKHRAAFSKAITANDTNWSLVASPAVGWSGKVFADIPASERIDRTWEAIFEMSRINHPDPVAHWREHIRGLDARSAYMNAKQYDALHLTAPGTDLIIGLPKNHLWAAAGTTSTPFGVVFTANIPTEEIWTAPDRARVDGVVRSAKPLNLQGVLIDKFSVTFKDGRVTDIQAEQGGDVLRKLVETDEGAARLGEIALVPNSSPISQFGRLFYHTLYDENASVHIAFGRAYAFNIQGGEKLSEEDLLAAGANRSLIHTDFMIGSGEMDIDGLAGDGSAEPLMRSGEWTFGV
jgi:aminopeptidase